MSSLDYGADPVAQVRLLIGDTDALIFTEQEILGLLALEDGHPHRAAAQALETIAITEALLSKKIKSQDLETDGPAVAETLRKLAAQYRQRAADDESAAAGGGIEIINYNPGIRVW